MVLKSGTIPFTGGLLGPTTQPGGWDSHATAVPIGAPSAAPGTSCSVPLTDGTAEQDGAWNWAAQYDS